MFKLLTIVALAVVTASVHADPVSNLKQYGRCNGFNGVRFVIF